MEAVRQSSEDSSLRPSRIRDSDSVQNDMQGVNEGLVIWRIKKKGHAQRAPSNLMNPKEM